MATPTRPRPGHSRNPEPDETGVKTLGGAVQSEMASLCAHDVRGQRRARMSKYDQNWISTLENSLEAVCRIACKPGRDPLGG